MAMNLSFNLQGALQAAKSLPGGSSQHVCAKYVRTFLEYGGLNTSGRPGLAREYTTYLPTIGFSHIGSLNSTDAQTQFTNSGVQPGDIAVYQKPGAPSEPGHICMWTGQQWVSDFRQSHMSVYRSRGAVQAHIFRWSGIVQNSPVDLCPVLGSSNFTSSAGGFEGLNGETLAQCCPIDIEFKGMWSRYQLRMGTRSKYINQFYTPGSNQIDFSFNMDAIPTNLTSSQCGISQEMLEHISMYETGHKFGYTMPSKDLNGYDNGDAGGHKTYGYGLLYHPTEGKYMDQVKSQWTQQELEGLFLASVAKRVQKVQSWAQSNGISLTQPQIDAIVSACYNFGDGFLTQESKCKGTGPLIAQNPNNPQIIETWSHGSDSQASKYPGLVKRRNFEAQWYKSGMA